ncbi:dihydroorotase [Desulfoplanes formicivorans]|uniref:Dihydroorotase n=1 Tax=Desulfoplanes formicivorans TaxID=1592317 RepID=A0A194AGW4_9BACT|nr:dihydroorotase [Desulfoplanes formicivorans]GAU08568.1 dihydroorotase [Desulfoplanes formicivorans]
MAAPQSILRNVIWLDQPMDLLIDQGTIMGLVPVDQGREITPLERDMDGQGAWLLPSLIDAHVHLREPGQEYKETIATGLQAALGGGFGQVMCMANTDPVNDHAQVTEYILETAMKTHPMGPRVRPVGALTKGLAGKELAPMAELARAGCVAFSNDGVPVGDNDLFRRSMEYAADLGLKVIDHCEDPTLSGHGVMNEGVLSGQLGLKGSPWVAETLHVARDIMLAEYLNIPVHLAHISCKESVEQILVAKEKGLPVTAETCAHYLVWDETMVQGYNFLAKVHPPLRTREDVMALRRAVKEGVIDILVTDHAPHADFEKETTMDEAPNGISGLDTALSLYASLVRDKVLTREDIVTRCALRPAEIFNLEVNRFAPGNRADFVLFDPDHAWIVEPSTMLSKGKNTPCMGTTLLGKVIAHYLKGQLAYTL